MPRRQSATPIQTSVSVDYALELTDSETESSESVPMIATPRRSKSGKKTKKTKRSAKKSEPCPIDDSSEESLDSVARMEQIHSQITKNMNRQHMHHLQELGKLIDYLASVCRTHTVVIYPKPGSKSRYLCSLVEHRKDEPWREGRHDLDAKLVSTAEPVLILQNVIDYHALVAAWSVYPTGVMTEVKRRTDRLFQVRLVTGCSERGMLEDLEVLYMEQVRDHLIQVNSF